LRDTIAGMLAFQHINRCTVTVSLKVTHDTEQAGVHMTAEAREQVPEGTEARLLASVKSIAGYSDRRTLDAVIFQLIYALDAQMAEHEFSQIKPKSE